MTSTQLNTLTELEEHNANSSASLPKCECTNAPPLWVLELACWTMVCFVLLGSWTAWSPVSIEQGVMRISLFTLSLGSAILLRFYRWRLRRATLDTAKEHARLSIAPRSVFAAALVLQTALLAYGAWIHSPTWDEIGHLGAGMIHWRTANFETYRVNPPLVRLIAAFPVMMAGAESPQIAFSANPHHRSEWEAGTRFIQQNGLRSFWYFTLARWACIPFSLAGAILCYRWAEELFGAWAGTFAGLLWCFCPSILGNGQLITPDVPAAVAGMAVLYAFWHWMKKPTWLGAICTGLLLGIAELTKLTWIILFPLLPIVWLGWLAMGDERRDMAAWRLGSLQLMVMIAIAVNTLNAGYLFEGTCLRLEDYQFVSSTLSGKTYAPGQSQSGNRFTGTLLGKLPVPVPANFLRGLDLQHYDFQRPRWSYLGGEWRDHGWWYYYFYALGVKLPLGMLLSLGLAIGCICTGRLKHVSRRDLFTLLFPTLVLLILLCTQTGLSRHHRYAMGTLPMLFIAASGLLAVRSTASRWNTSTAWLLILYAIGSSIWFYPHSLSYFNEVAGGPLQGARHLLDSNIDWGQDMFFLRRWYDQHPEIRPLGISPKLPGWLLNPIDLGLEDVTGIPRAVATRTESEENPGPLPGWYAVSVCSLYSKQPDTHYLRDHVEPVGHVGYSLVLYHLDREAAQALRRQLGFKPLLRVPLTPELPRKTPLRESEGLESPG